MNVRFVVCDFNMSNVLNRNHWTLREFKHMKPSDPFHKLVDQLATDMTYYNEMLIRRDRYGEMGLDTQIDELKQCIDVKRAIAEGLKKGK
jgi:hypothetical protein